MKTHKLGIAFAAVLIVIASAGCGSSSNDADQKGVEKDSGAKVDSDSDTGSANVEAGGTETDTGSSLPDDFPEFLALPDGFTVLTADTTDVGKGPRTQVIATGKGDGDAIFATYKKNIQAEGYEIVNENALGDPWSRDLDANKADSGVSVVLGKEGVGDELKPGEIELTVTYGGKVNVPDD